jgi:class 3 adenylate cyclase
LLHTQLFPSRRNGIVTAVVRWVTAATSRARRGERREDHDVTRDERHGQDGAARQAPPTAPMVAARADAPAPVEVPPVVDERDPARSATMRPSRPPTDEVRIGDAERQVVVDQLREAVGSGHLTLDEFAERVEAAWRAVIPSELAPLVQDLPGAPSVSPAAAAGSAPATSGVPSAPTSTAPGGVAPTPVAAPAAGGKARSSVISIMCGSDTRGRWRVAPKVRAFAFWGAATVDLREALIESPAVDIYATAIMGGVTVIVPEGIPVELDGFVLMGGSTNRAKTAGVLPGAPVVRVHASGLWGGIDVKTKSHRRDRSATREALDDAREALEAIGHAGPAGHGRRHAPTPAPAAASSPPVTSPPTPPPPSVPPPPRAANHRRSSRDRGSRRTNDLPEGTLTIMFTDIVDSTAAVEAMGDHRWSEVVAGHDRALRRIVAARGGTVVKGNGDGYLVVFPSARQAVLAGLEVRDGADVALRVGLHTGEVVRQDDDIYGRNVIAASRIAGAADPGQVVVSALTKDLVDSAGDLCFSEARTVELKGLTQPWQIHEARLEALTP